MAKAPLTHTLMALKFQMVSISAPCLGSSWALKLGRHNLSRARLLPGWRRPRPRCLGSGWPWAAAQHSVREPAPEAGDRRAVASGERDGVDTEATVLPSRRPRPLPLRAHSRPRRRCPFFLKRVRRFRSRGTRGRRPVGGKARVQVTFKMVHDQGAGVVDQGDRLSIGGTNSISAVNVMKTETV